MARRIATPERLHDPPDDVAQDLRLRVGLSSRPEAGQVQEVLDDGVEPVRVGRDVGDHRCPNALVELRARVCRSRALP